MITEEDGSNITVFTGNRSWDRFRCEEFCMIGKVFFKKHALALGLILGMGCLFFSCREFFSTSLAPWAARDPDKLVPGVTVGNVNELLAAMENNPDMSMALLKKIKEAADRSSGSDKAKLQNSALKAAVNAAGLGSAVLNKVGEIASVGNPDDAKKLLVNAINDMKNLVDAGSILTSTLPKPGDAEFAAFTDAADPDDLAINAALLLAGEAKKHGNIDNYIDNIFDRQAPATATENLAVNMAVSAVDKYVTAGINGPFKDLLDGINLT
jgi:hypothetical protein